MTDREPFAKFLREDVGLEDRAEIGGVTLESFGRVDRADVDGVNAAFNKRLDEELEKAKKVWEAEHGRP